MRSSPALFVILIVGGLGVLIWPEQDNLMLVQLAPHHGPSRLDTIGLLLMACGYVPLVIITVRRFRRVKQRLSSGITNSLVVAYFVSLGAIAIALYVNREFLLWVAVAIATTCQLLLTGTALMSHQQHES